VLNTTSIWGNRFVIAAVVQGSSAIVTGLTLSIVAIQSLFSSSINIINSSLYLLKVQLNGSSLATYSI
jgi:hypothetical protein